MNCERQRSAIREVALGATPSGPLDAHLDSCPACRSVLDIERRRLAGIDEELRDALAVEPSVYLLSRVRADVAGGQAPSRARRLAWLAPVAVGAAALALVVLAPRRISPPPREVSPFPAPPVTWAQPIPAASPTGPVDQAARGTRVRPTTARAASARPQGEPEVLVPRGGETALRRFLDSVRGLELTPEANLAVGPALLAPSEARVDPLWPLPVERVPEEVKVVPPALEPALLID